VSFSGFTVLGKDAIHELAVDVAGFDAAAR
jgi:hypothetical protein